MNLVFWNILKIMFYNIMKNSYYKKYLKYKNKYLQLKENLDILNKHKGGEFIPYNLEQKTWHEILNRMNEEFIITGCGYIFQWHNESYSKNLPKTITLFGEAHGGLNSFSPAKNLPEAKRGIQKRYPRLPEDSLKGRTDRLEEQTRFLVVELFWYLFKGTRRCLDFYLEDWKTERNHFNIRWEDIFRNWDLDKIMNFYRGGRELEFTISNLEIMLDHDMHNFVANPIHGELRNRKDIKKFNNIRAHYNEYRIPERKYNVLLPYNNGRWYVRNQNIIKNRILRYPVAGGERLPIDSIRRFLNKVGELYKLLACVNIREGGDLYEYLPYGVNPRDDFDRAYNDLKIAFDAKYQEIINEYTSHGTIIDKIRSIKKEKNNVYYPILKKVLKNLWDCDSKTQRKFINFFNLLFSLGNIIDSMRINYTDLRLAGENIDYFIRKNYFEVLKISKIWLVDIYSLSRNIKTFSLKNQSNNLKESSSCFNNNDLSNRNVVCYDGYYHTFNYYFFYRYYFESLPSLSICSDNGLFPDFNNYLSNYINYDAATRTSSLINKPLTEETLPQYCNQYWLLLLLYKGEGGDIGIDLNVDNIIPRNTFGKLFKNQLIDNKHYIQKNRWDGLDRDFYQALPNKYNIIKKILINISKERNERTQLVKNLKYLDDISSIMGSLLNSNIQRNIISRNGWFHNYYLFSKLKDINIRALGERFDLFNKNKLLGVLAKGNYYIGNEFYGDTLANSKLRLITDILPENELNNDKRSIDGILTDIVNDMFFDSFRNKLEFLKVVYRYLEEAYNRWCEHRYSFYTDGIYPVGSYPDGFQEFLAGDTAEVRLDKIRNNMRVLPIVKLLFKGGMTLRLLFFDLKKQFNIRVEKELLDKFGDYFKVSDFDFETKINLPSDKEKINRVEEGAGESKGFEEGESKGVEADDVSKVREVRKTKFDQMFNELSLLNFIIIRDLTDSFNNSYFSSRLFKLNNMDYGVREAKLESYLIKLNKLIPSFGVYNNIKSFSHLIAGNNIATPSENIYQLEENYNKYNYEHHLPIADRKISEEEVVETKKIISNTKIGVALMETEIPLTEAGKNNILNKINNNIPAERRLGEIINDIPEGEKIKAFNLYEIENFYENFVNKLPFDDKENRTNINEKYNLGSFYQTWNSRIYRTVGSFNLCRIKYNFNLLGKYNDDTSFIMNNGGEVVDISLPDKENSKARLNLETKRFTFENSDLDYTSYSIKGHIMDLFSILFIENVEPTDLERLRIVNGEIYDVIPDETTFITPPWRDKKYSKRIDRLMVLIFIQKMILVNNINQPVNLDLIRRTFISFKESLNVDLPKIGFSPDTNLERLINIRNELLKLFNIREIIPNNKKINSLIGGVDVRTIFAEGRANSTQALKYENSQLLDTPVDDDCPNVNDTILNKINHLADINGLITFIYLNIRFLNYYIYNLERIPRREENIIFELNERGDNYKITDYFNHIINTIDIILNIVATIREDTYPEVNTIDPKNLD